jgi:F-type H+-transporting ATPase subunit epsilon
MALHFELVSPAKLLFSGDVTSVTLPGSEGEMGIFAGHAPLLSTLRPGYVTIAKDGGTTEKIFVRGGFAEVNPQGLTVLAETAIASADLSASAMAEQVASAEVEYAEAKDDEGKRKALENVEHLKGLQAGLM